MCKCIFSACRVKIFQTEEERERNSSAKRRHCYVRLMKWFYTLQINTGVIISFVTIINQDWKGSIHPPMFVRLSLRKKFLNRPSRSKTQTLFRKIITNLDSTKVLLWFIKLQHWKKSFFCRNLAINFSTQLGSLDFSIAVVRVIRRVNN